jgi:nucleotide-binding universal stress UspA family protein
VIAQRGEHEKWSTGLLGSTTESVVRKSPDPVLVTPNSFNTFKNVVIAYDGGTEAYRALKTACEFLIGFSTSIKVVFVTDNDNRSMKLTEEVREFTAPFNLNLQTVRLQGDPGKEILHYAENSNADLIIMGAFGHSRLHDIILGGTTAYIMRKSSIPVLLNR